MGSAKDKHGVRESFAKVTCVFAKNDRSQIKKFWSTTIYGRAAMRGDSMWFFFAPPTGWDNIITWACAFGLWWYSEERCSYCILNLYTPYIYIYIYILYKYIYDYICEDKHLNRLLALWNHLLLWWPTGLQKGCSSLNKTCENNVNICALKMHYFWNVKKCILKV
jgi:hypothetical protein